MKLYHKFLLLFSIIFTALFFYAFKVNKNITRSNDLARYDFFYAGESKTQNMYFVKNGKIDWEFNDPEGKGEISDAIRYKNGNVLFAHQYGVKLITKNKKVIWEYTSPKKTEVHTAQLIGDDHVIFLQNGNPAQVFVMNIKTGETVKNFKVPVKNLKKVHGQFRHARLTKDGTYLITHLNQKLAEYDYEGNVVFEMNVKGIWSATPLDNGNILICGNDLLIREVTKLGEVVWDFNLNDYPDLKITQPQIATRLANGNTIINNWFNEWSQGEVDLTNPPIQAIEVTPKKEVVWVIKSWKTPNLGPSTTIQIKDQHTINSKQYFGSLK